MKNTQLTTGEVKNIAKLAQLKLTEDEVAKFQDQLSEVLNYVEVLGELNTDRVEPTSQVTGLENVEREDEVENSLTPEEALSGALVTERQMFATSAVFQGKNES